MNCVFASSDARGRCMAVQIKLTRLCTYLEKVALFQWCKVQMFQDFPPYGGGIKLQYIFIAVLLTVALKLQVFPHVLLR